MAVRVVAFLLILGSGFALLSWLARKLIYYPSRYPSGPWTLQTALRAQDVWLQASDGVKLHAWWIPAPEARFVTLFLHGNAGNISHRADRARVIPAAGSALLLLDYRGYGKSEGAPGEQGLYRDADAAYQFLRDQGFAASRIVVHGESLGTAVAVELAARRECAGVILEAPFRSIASMAATVVPGLGPLLVTGYDTEARIRRLLSPLLVIHGDRDEVVPFSQGEAVFAAAPPPKRFWRVPGAHHNDLMEFAGDAYPKYLRAFYQELP